MLDSGGRAASVITSQLSKPTIATSAGTPMPRSRNASAAPRAIWSLPQNSASGGLAPAVEQPVGGGAPPRFRPDAAQAEAVDRRQPCRGERGEIAVAAQLHRLEMFRAGDVRDAAAAEPRQVLDGQHRAALVVGQQAQRVRIVGLA